MRLRVALLACVITACGSFGTSSEESSSTDGGNNTPRVGGDSGAPPLDGSTESDAASTCVKRTRFDDGFERPNAEMIGAWNAYQSYKGTLAIDQILPLRGGASLKVDLTASLDGYARLKRAFTAGETCPVRVSFVFKLKSFPTGAGGQVTIMHVRYGLGELELRLLQNQKLEIADDPNGLSASHFTLPFEGVVDEVVTASFTFDTKLKHVDYSFQRAGGAPIKGFVTFNTNYDQPTDAVFGADKVETAAPLSYFLDDIVIE